jgi:hypothetical protein
MTDNITKYFNNTEALDELSVTEIEHLINLAPSSSVYKLLLAKKMSNLDGQHLLLSNSDRVMVHYLMENNVNIPTVTDLNISANPIKLVSDTSIEMEPTISNSEIEVSNEADTTTLTDKIVNEMEGNLIVAMDQEIPMVAEEIVISDLVLDTQKVKKHKKKKKNKFKLNEYSGISNFSKWLLSFKKDDVEKQIKKEEKAAKKRALEQSAKKSITKSPAIISEPLAELLANQGHFDDAKKMFEQLMQKYPEKSSYFAAKINLLIKS